MPNALLLRLYEVMRELGSTARSRSVEACPRGQEAVYAAGLLSLRSTDLVCAEGPKPRDSKPEPDFAWLDTGDARASERLLLALGAAAALCTRRSGNLVMIFAAVDDLTPAQWQQVLGRAGAQSLPVIFVAISERRPGWLSSNAQGWGVPGIPVDASDAIALYRVLQESVVRARHGDGAALLEPIAWTIGRPVDPLRSMRQLLEGRGLLTPDTRTSRRPRGAAASRSAKPRTAGSPSK